MLSTRRNFLQAAATGFVFSKTAHGAPPQPWVKKGRILEPGFAGTLSNQLLSAPSVIRRPNGRLRMYFWTRHRSGEEQSNYIYAAEASTSSPRDWTVVGKEPMLEASPTGNISDKGPSFPWVLPREEGGWLMYYAVWGSWAPPGMLSNRTSLAISHDQGLSWEVLREPLLPLGKPGSFDGGITGSVCVLETGRRQYQMWYTAGERRQHFDDGTTDLIVHIGHARSTDGVEWVKTDALNPVLLARQEEVEPYENIVSKPCVLLLDGVYHMWFSLRAHDGRGYRISYAKSKDGLHWHRPFREQVIPPTQGAFDSEHQSYPNVVEVGDELWMFYVGNRFGQTGIGLATMKKADLV